jgi:quercetin dioxygenase-like cupin family protein
MKITLATIAAAGLLLWTLPSNATAQDWMTVNPKNLHTLVDTTLIRAYVVTLAPGEKSGIHSHPAEFFYALTTGKIKVFYTDGDSVVMAVKAGESGYSDPERPHWVQNVGSTTARWIELEMKEHPYTGASR